MSNNTVNFNKALYDCATECALRRLNRTCKKKFESASCQRCRYYVKHYVNADPRHVELFMMEAENNAYNLHHDARQSTVLILILIGLACLFVYGIASQRIKNAAYWKEQQSLAPTTTIVRDEIWLICDKVARDMRLGKDYNGDGLINCIDAAVAFYKYYPDKSKVCIERNINPPVKFNHLFNCVLINGVWRAIEPQAAYIRRDNTYWMRSYWGKQYDYTLNKDETEQWKKYTR